MTRTFRGGKIVKNNKNGNNKKAVEAQKKEKIDWLTLYPGLKTPQVSQIVERGVREITSQIPVTGLELTREATGFGCMH